MNDVVTFQSVLNGVAIALGLVPSRDLNANRAVQLTEYINQRVRRAWKFAFWPGWTVVEKRMFRQQYDPGLFIEAGDEVFHAADQKYYQALQLQNPAVQAPSLLTAGVYVENSQWWALCNQTYSPGDWVTAHDYVVGDQVRNPDNDLQYQCITAHTSGASFDATMFGQIRPFDKYIAYEQVGKTAIDGVKAVYRRNPRVYTNNPGSLTGFTMLGAGGLAGTGGAGYGAVGFAPSDNGIQVDWRAPAVVWVEFRKRPPMFTSTVWDSDLVYDEGDVVFYQGDCYRSLIGMNVTNPTGTADWELVPMPAILSTYVKQAAFSDALRDQKQTDRAVDEINQAELELMDARDREQEQQGQYETAHVVTYGR